MAVDTADVRLVGRNGVVTLDEASAAIRKLREATRTQLADALGVKPLALGRLIPQLVERKLAEADQDERGLFYRALMDPLPGEVFEPREREPEVNDAVSVAEPDEGQKAEQDAWAAEVRRYGRVTIEEGRDWALLLERFTINQLATEMQVAWATADRIVKVLVAQDIVVDSGWVGKANSRIFELRGEVEDSAQRHRRRQTPVEREVLEKFGSTIHIERRGITQALGELPRLSTDKDVNLLVAEAKAFGWEVELRSKHSVIVPPGATRPIPIPSTPKGAGMVRAFRDQLRAAGLPDLGDPNAQEVAVRRGEVVDGTSRSHKRRQAMSNVAGTRRPGRTNKRGPNRHGKR